MECNYKSVGDKSDSESQGSCSALIMDTKETHSVITMEDSKKTPQGGDEVDNIDCKTPRGGDEVANLEGPSIQEKAIESKNVEGGQKTAQVKIPTKKDEDKAAKRPNGYTDVITTVPNVSNNGPTSPSINIASNSAVPVANRNMASNLTPVGQRGHNKPAENVCIFCLDTDDLIHMCQCSAMAHKKCALEYIRFPGANNDKCAQCREKLHYDFEKNSPMKNRYVILFIFLVLLYCTMFGVSVWLTNMLIPSGMNTFLRVCIVANLSILWPLILVFLVVWGLEASLGPYDRTRSTCNDPGCYWSGDCGGGDCDCCDSGGGDGDACAIVLCVLLLVAILLLMIAATWWLIVSLTKFYKSFSLKSKKKITFRHEKRRLNTLGDQNPTISKLVTKQPLSRPDTVIEVV